MSKRQTDKPDPSDIWNHWTTRSRQNFLATIQYPEKYAKLPFRLLPFYIQSWLFRYASVKEGKHLRGADPRRLYRRVVSGRVYDPRVLRVGVGKIGGQPHGYLGRHVLDLGDRHAHAIVDIPWDALKVNLKNMKAQFDPWRQALKGFGARLLAIRNPRPTGPGDRAIVEAAIHVGKGKYEALKRSGEFDILPDGVLARRGRRKKATNIFILP